jgi:hypothetical protein
MDLFGTDSERGESFKLFIPILVTGLLLLIGWAVMPSEGQAQANLPSWASPSSYDQHSSVRSRSQLSRESRIHRRGIHSPHRTEDADNIDSFGGKGITYGPGGNPGKPTMCSTQDDCPDGTYCAKNGKCVRNGKGPGNPVNGEKNPPNLPIPGLVWLAVAGLGYGGYRLR